MDEHDRRRRLRRELRVIGTLRIAEKIESWEVELMTNKLASPGVAPPATRKMHDDE